MSTTLHCRLCAKPVEKGAPVTKDDATFVCEDCGQKGYPQNGWVHPVAAERRGGQESEKVPSPKPSILKRIFKKNKAP